MNNTTNKARVERSAELKPCPFCGSSNTIHENYIVEACAGCLNCGAKIIRKHGPHDESGFECCANDWNTRAQAADGVRVGPIERDEQMQRDYIPLAGGYEFQTKGNGSTARLLCPDGMRHPLTEAAHVLRAFEAMARAQHAALNAPENNKGGV